MKKLIVCMTAVLLCFCLSGCGGKGSDVEITMPGALANAFVLETYDDEFQVDITSSKTNEDGTVTYQIKKESYDEFIKHFEGKLADSIDALLSDGELFGETAIRDITWEKGFAKVAVSVDYEEYQENFTDPMTALEIGRLAYTFQIFQKGGMEQVDAVTIEVLDEASDEVKETLGIQEIMAVYDDLVFAE